MPDSSSFADDDVVSIDDGAWGDNTIKIDLVITTKLSLLTFPEVWSLEGFVLFLCVRVGSEEGRSEKTPVN